MEESVHHRYTAEPQQSVDGEPVSKKTKAVISSTEKGFRWGGSRGECFRDNVDYCQDCTKKPGRTDVYHAIRYKIRRRNTLEEETETTCTSGGNGETKRIEIARWIRRGS